MLSRWLGFASVILFFLVTPADPLPHSKAQPAVDLNALFDQKDGWIGADGTQSVALTPHRTLWLFSDTWVGSVRDGKRTNATIVNNSAALQEGKGPGAKVRFVVRRDGEGKPTALLTPADGHGWFWLQAGALVRDRLFLFLSQVEKTKDPGVFGFRQVGQWLGVVANPHDDPTAWRVEQRKLPCTIFAPERELTFGAAVLEDGDYLYIFGTDEDVKPAGRDRYLILARARVTELEDFAAWRFYRDGEWRTDHRTATRMTDRMASEGSVSFLPRQKRYVLVCTDRGLSSHILARTAPTPWGPWSAAVKLYDCPETGWDKRIFCYGAKAHPSQAVGDELVISYFSNSFDFWHVAADARLYWPRFLRVPLRENP